MICLLTSTSLKKEGGVAKKQTPYNKKKFKQLLSITNVGNMNCFSFYLSCKAQTEIHVIFIKNQNKLKQKELVSVINNMKN